MNLATRPLSRISNLLRSDQYALAAASLVAALLTFVQAKTVAVRFGPDGVGYQGSLIAAGALVGSFAILGMNTAIPRVLAKIPQVGSRQLLAGVIRVLLLTAPACLLLGYVALRAQFQIFPTTSFAVGLALVSIGWLGNAIRMASLAALRGSRAVSYHLLVTAVTSTLVTVPLVLLLQFKALPAILGLASGAALIASLLLVRHVPSQLRGPQALSRQLLKEGIHPYLASLSAIAGLTAMPVIALSLSGSQFAGLLKSAYALGTAVPTIAIAVITSDFYPRFATAVRDGDPISVTRSSLSRVAGFLLPGTLAVTLSAPLLLRTFYTPQFVAASTCLCLIAVGCTVQAIGNYSWFGLLSAGGGSSVILAQSVAMTVLCAGTFLGSAVGSLAAIGVAYMLCWVTFGTLSHILGGPGLGPHSPWRAVRGRMAFMIGGTVATGLVMAVVWAVLLD